MDHQVLPAALAQARAFERLEEREEKGEWKGRGGIVGMESD